MNPSPVEPDLLGPAIVSGSTLVDGILDHVFGLETLRRIPDTQDQLWRRTGTVTVQAMARYAGLVQELGIFERGGPFQPVLTVTSYGLLEGIPNDSITPSGWFAFGGGPAGSPFSSIASQNPFGGDQMVTWRVTSGIHSGRHVIAWEDLTRADADFNDLVVLVSGAEPVPEPATVLLIGTGLAALAERRRRKKRLESSSRR